MRTQQVSYLSGRYKSVDIAKTYTAQTSLSDFIANALYGEIAIVKKSDNSIFDGTTAIPSETEVFLIKKLNNGAGYKSLPPFTFKSTNPRVSNYANITTVVGVTGNVPVKKVTISYGGTADCGGSVNGIADIREVYSLSVVYGVFNGVLDELNYTYSCSPGETILSVINKLITKVTDPNSLENQGKQLRVSISGLTTVVGTSPTPSTTTFNVTGLNFLNFTLGVIGFCSVAVVDLVRGTQPINGYDDVFQMEKEGVIVDGRFFDKYVLPPFENANVFNYLIDDFAPTTLFTGYQIDRVNVKKAELAGVAFHTNTYQELIFAGNGTPVTAKLNTLFGF